MALNGLIPFLKRRFCDRCPSCGEILRHSEGKIRVTFQEGTVSMLSRAAIQKWSFPSTFRDEFLHAVKKLWFCDGKPSCSRVNDPVFDFLFLLQSQCCWRPLFGFEHCFADKLWVERTLGNPKLVLCLSKWHATFNSIQSCNQDVLREFCLRFLFPLFQFLPIDIGTGNNWKLLSLWIHFLSKITGKTVK